MPKEKIEAMTLAQMTRRFNLSERDLVAFAAGLAQFASGSFDPEVEAAKEVRRYARDEAPIEASRVAAEARVKAARDAERAEGEARAKARLAREARQREEFARVRGVQPLDPRQGPPQMRLV